VPSKKKGIEMAQKVQEIAERVSSDERRPVSPSLEQHARLVATQHVLLHKAGKARAMLDRLEAQEDLLNRAYRHFATPVVKEPGQSYAAEWVLDNFHILQQAVREIREDMPEGFYRRLPKLKDSIPELMPRVYAVAREIFLACAGHLHMETTVRFVQAYQGIASLSIGEVWALPAMLRVIVVEYVSRALSRLIRLPLKPEQTPSAVLKLPDEISDEQIVANAILSLRMVADEDWKDFFERVSLVERALRNDPTAIYPAMDFETRDAYRKKIEDLARAAGASEVDVAKEAVALALEDSRRAGSPQTSHVGYYVVDAGRTALEHRLQYRPALFSRLGRWLLEHPSPLYLSAIWSTTAAIATVVILYAASLNAPAAQISVICLLFLIPLLRISTGIINWILTHALPPRVLPKLDYRKDFLESRIMVVIPTLLTDSEEIKSLLRQIERHYLANADPHISFALLGDFTDAPAKHMPGDEDLVAQAVRGIQELNARHPRAGSNPFSFFNREREFSASEGVWMGWERKRGNLQQLNYLLMGKPSTYTVRQGDLQILPEIKYVITLDADTVLPHDSARKLAAVFAHPLNQPQFDAENRLVSGYTILQPRTEVQPTSANQSLFTRIFVGDTGLDLYTRAVSDVYQDLFGEGIYVGKGMYELAAFEKTLERKLPENAILSHDLIEGLHGRVALVSDVVFLEDYPRNFLTFMHRLHRWARGDWQLLPWLFSGKLFHRDERVNVARLPAISRWKIFDNLCRSLITPCLFALLVLSWFWFKGSAFVWTLLFILAPAVPLAAAVTIDWRKTNSMRLAVMRAARWFLVLVFLPYESLVMLHAVLSTLFRLAISRKRLLQWTTAAHAIHIFKKERMMPMFWQQMLFAPLIAAITGLALAFARIRSFPVAAPLLFLWILSPQVAYLLSRPYRKKKKALPDDQRRRLRFIARRTWLFFEQFVGPEDHWLPPDHFQESPRGLVAHRTSITNIGLMFISISAAYELGYIGALNMVSRLRNAFESMHLLERYRGHFLNWYDTRTLNPLPPRYVSTVDSGNLAACLIALKETLRVYAAYPVMPPQRWQGLTDTIAVLDAAAQDLRHVPQGATDSLLRQLAMMRERVERAQRNTPLRMSLLNDLESDRVELERTLMALMSDHVQTLGASSLNSLRTWSERIRHHLFDMRRELDTLTPWLSLLDNPPPSLKPYRDSETALLAEIEGKLQGALHFNRVAPVAHEVRQLIQRLREHVRKDASLEIEQQRANEWLNRLERQVFASEENVRQLLDDFQDLILLAEMNIREMQFGFLFDWKREIFHIGYNVDSEQLDNNRYDLLASEARIASIVAIAKGDIPQSHWLHLSRPLALLDGTRGLLSWAGTMFEYLMPALLLRQYDNSLLEHSSRAAVKRQLEYCKKKDVPWGISESGYYRFDINMNYQYRAFGVPGLGFKRGLSEDLVIAPYASLLALPVRPREVMQNVERLIQLQMLGLYGFYEAADYTPARLVLGQERSIVRSFMSHHQSMILLSIANHLLDDVMVRRFHADPAIQSSELLLQEQVPYGAPIERFPIEEVAAALMAHLPITATPWQAPVHSAFPQAYYLSNGNYGVLITSAGSGCSIWKDIDVTRWRADTTLDDWGTWIYVQDLDSEQVSSVGYQPTATLPQDREVFFYPHKADFRCKMGDIIVHMEVTVPPEDDGEIRRITITNQSAWPRRLAITSYAEVVLAPRETDRRHQAFNKMFIESSFEAGLNALVFNRRTRSPGESPVHLVHMLILEPGIGPAGMHETERRNFIGRGKSLRAPAAIGREGPVMSNTTGATLDPIMALGQEIIIEPHASLRVAFISLIAERRSQALDLANRYQEWHIIDRAYETARARSELELRQLKAQVDDLQRYQQVLSLLMYPHHALRAEPAVLAANSKGQPSLWPFAISGDYPLLLVRIGREEESPLVRELLKAHTYWRNRGLKIDLVILNMRETGYSQELHNHLVRLLAQSQSDTWLNQRGGIFMLRADQMSGNEQCLIETTARVILDGEKGSFAQQLEKLQKPPVYLPAFVPTPPPEAQTNLSAPPVERPRDLLFDNGIGGFSPDGKEYIIYIQPDRWTPAPWINVVANAEFGFFVSEAGGACTWAANSGENRLSSWSNDPVLDRPGEALYLRDEETAEVWSPTPLPAGTTLPYLVRHGAGYSNFEHNSHGIRQILTLFPAENAPLKIVHLRLENLSQRTRRITATYYVDAVLGNSRENMQQYVIPEYDQGAHAILLRNPYNVDFGERVAFLATQREPFGFTTDRTEFLGRAGDFKLPAALKRVGLSGNVIAGIDPCAAIQLHIDLYPKEAVDEYFLLGQGTDRQAALDIIAEFQEPARIESALTETRRKWNSLLDRVQVDTPDTAMNLLLNRWLLYQNLSCRVWGRTALYQSSGAFGFRDQLQDVVALCHTAPDIARAHILRAARHQFEAGDVLHWWHPPAGKGVRTRTSDDLLWLPFVTAKYVSETGDVTILHEQIPFLHGDPLKPDEAERYGQYPLTVDIASLYEHCRRAIRKGITAGPHDLPLMGTGDWNDGMSNIGAKGIGESVWLGWFLCAVLNEFIPICRLLDDEDSASAYSRRIERLQKAIETHAWDGEWYLRAYHDDGSPVGSSRNAECKIDSIAQSWAVLSGAGDPQRSQRAMNAVLQHLVRLEERLVLLFTPPFHRTSHDPGYIRGYPPGIRENGGQYTHAALWVAWAFTKVGEGEWAESLFRLLNPVYHADSPEKMERYHVEPYVAAADVYGVPPFVGRGGWTWYTGSGGWMYRLGLEAILGLRRRGQFLEFNPCIPKSWPQFKITYRFGAAEYHIRVENPQNISKGIKYVEMDGRPALDKRIPLKDDGRRHEVIVRMGID